MGDLKQKFSRIYDDNVRAIFRFILLKVNSEEIAQDLCSQTFLRAWEAFQNKKSKIKNQKEEIRNPSAFLYRIARNLVIDHYRTKGRTEIVPAEYVTIIDPSPNPIQETVSESDFYQVRQALANLKHDYQDIIIWHYLDSFSISKIAKILDKNEGAVRMMIHRALKGLRKELEA